MRTRLREGRVDAYDKRRRIPYQVHDIIQDTADYASDQPAKASKQAAEKAALQLLACGADVKHTPGTPKSAIDWSRRLPRSYAEVLSMMVNNSDRSGFIAATAADDNSLKEMGA